MSHARADLAQHARRRRVQAALVALVGVVRALRVRRRGGRRAGEHVLVPVGRVRGVLDALDDLVDLGGQRVARRLVDRVAAALDHQVAGAVDELGDRVERGLGRVLPVLGVLDVALVGGVRRQRPAQAHRAGGVVRVVRRAGDLLARGGPLLRLAQLAREVVEVREDVALDHAGRDAHGYKPTFPVRLISTSSISSIVDMAREDAW